jgi:hypothetical protein
MKTRRRNWPAETDAEIRAFVLGFETRRQSRAPHMRRVHASNQHCPKRNRAALPGVRVPTSKPVNSLDPLRSTPQGNLRRLRQSPTSGSTKSAAMRCIRTSWRTVRRKPAGGRGAIRTTEPLLRAMDTARLSPLGDRRAAHHSALWRMIAETLAALRSTALLLLGSSAGSVKAPIRRYCCCAPAPTRSSRSWKTPPLTMHHWSCRPSAPTSAEHFAEEDIRAAAPVSSSQVGNLAPATMYSAKLERICDPVIQRGLIRSSEAIRPAQFLDCQIS